MTDETKRIRDEMAEEKWAGLRIMRKVWTWLEGFKSGFDSAWPIAYEAGSASQVENKFDNEELKEHLFEANAEIERLQNGPIAIAHMKACQRNEEYIDQLTEAKALLSEMANVLYFYMLNAPADSVGVKVTSKALTSYREWVAKNGEGE